MSKLTPETATLKDYWENRQALIETALMLGLGLYIVSFFQKEPEITQKPAPIISFEKPHKTSQAQKKAPEATPSLNL